jgi:small-conductance mechanosensitive channel
MGFIEKEIEKLKAIKECQERILRESNDPLEKESARKALLTLQEEIAPLEKLKKNIEEKEIHFRNEEEEREFFNLVMEKGFEEAEKLIKMKQEKTLGRYSICTTCGYMGWPKIEKKEHISYVEEFFVFLTALLMSLGISSLLEVGEDEWFINFLIFLGCLTVEFIIYDKFYLKKTIKIICPACKHPTMIPTDTPRGKELVEKQLLKTKKGKNSLDN